MRRVTDGSFEVFRLGTESRDAITRGQNGLTKRELFAAMAMQGMLANNDAVNRIWAKAKLLNEDPVLAGEACESCIAEAAVSTADKLVHALNEVTP